MKATEIIDQKVMDRTAVQYRRAMWEFQRHAVGLAAIGGDHLEHATVAALNAMAEHADRLLVLVTGPEEMAHSIASLHHVDAVHHLAPSELAELVVQLHPEVVYDAPGFEDVELPADAIHIRIL